MMNNTREHALVWLLSSLGALGAAACVPEQDAKIGKTDEHSSALTVAACEDQGGVALADPGDGSLLASGCPDGQTQLGYIDGFFEGGLCCQGDDTPTNTSYTPEECEAAGGVPMADPGDGSLLAAGCPDGQTKLGEIDGYFEGGLCCQAHGAPTMPYTVAECESAGGVARSDPGDGSLIANGCPEPETTLGLISEPGWDEGGLCCEPDDAATETYTVAECESAGGVARSDPGDGSLIENGCPEPETTLGLINESGWDEGGLCCAP